MLHNTDNYIFYVHPFTVRQLSICYHFVAKKKNMNQFNYAIAASCCFNITRCIKTQMFRIVFAS